MARLAILAKETKHEPVLRPAVESILRNRLDSAKGLYRILPGILNAEP